MANNQGIRGIRQSIPSGFVIGRSSPGSSKGQPGLVPLPPSTQQALIQGAGGKATSGGGSVGAGTISGTSASTSIASGTGITISGSFPNFTVTLQTPVTVGNGGTGTASAGQLPATATNDSAAAGKLGEYVSATSNSTSQTDNTASNLATISLTAGDWDVFGSITYKGATAALTDAYACVSLTTLDTSQTNMLTSPWARITTTTGAALTTDYLNLSVTPPPLRVSITTTTTVYLVAYCRFASGTFNAFGSIQARRAR